MLWYKITKIMSDKYPLFLILLFLLVVIWSRVRTHRRKHTSQNHSRNYFYWWHIKARERPKRICNIYLPVSSSFGRNNGKSSTHRKFIFSSPPRTLCPLLIQINKTTDNYASENLIECFITFYHFCFCTGIQMAPMYSNTCTKYITTKQNFGNDTIA